MTKKFALFPAMAPDLKERLQEASNLVFLNFFTPYLPSWRYASSRSVVPTIIYCARVDGRKGESARGNIWVANLDAVLNAKWLESMKVGF